MADAAAKSALAGHLPDGRFGADGEPGLRLSETRGLALVHVAANVDDIAAPDGCRVLRLGPDHWLVKAPGGNAGDLAANLAAAVPGGAINDVTFGRTTFRLDGPRARDVLAAGCPLDLHESAFGAGASAASLLGHLQVVIECTGAETFEVSVTRSYGRDLAEWLSRAAAEFGFEVIS